MLSDHARLFLLPEHKARSLMDGRDFVPVADALAARSTEADWRSAVSRAYYAAFHVARQLLHSCGFAVPRGDQAHAYLWLRLANAGHVNVCQAGNDLSLLRRHRNEADYHLSRPLDQATTLARVGTAKEIIRVLTSADAEPTKTQITDAMKIYERAVLQNVTWHP